MNAQRPNADLWIDHPGGNHIRGGPSDYMMNGIGTSAVDMKSLTGPEVVESPPPRYHTMQDSTYGTVSIRHTRTPTRHSVSSYDDDLRRLDLEGRRPVVIGRAKPILATVAYAPTYEDSQGTLSRSYHHSESSLDGQRQRTPQVVYTGSGRHQPIAKVELGDSPYGSTSALTTTPPVPMQAPPPGPPSMIDGYRTLRGGANASSQSQGPFRCKFFSSYASCSSDIEAEKKQVQSEVVPTVNPAAVRPSNSTEELNAQMENLDTMIDDLQALQHEFGVVS
ncbi:unnamed protein product [Angiostrongylus costaricensis]|uniref:Neogenin_C domain-containing protein n=1 Tax=Angiostrongylus costaricensis TaxID=334426 RepID=A0A0R3P9E7_ANGCS|nr:unnamed protein product [Angiostrongylus costaricensis]